MIRQRMKEITMWKWMTYLVALALSTGCVNPGRDRTAPEAAATGLDAITAIAPPVTHADTKGVRASGAKAYDRWLDRSLDRLMSQLPEMTRSAEAAAEVYVRTEGTVGIIGDAGTVAEATGRAGGLIHTRNSGNPCLLFPQRIHREGQKDLAAALPSGTTLHTSVTADMTVVLFGRRPVLDAAKKNGLPFIAFIETSPSPHGGVLEIGSGHWVIPADPALNMAALWMWTGEFVAACTRLGKMPTMYQSYSVPGSKERAEKLRQTKFHAESPKPVPARQLALAYLEELKSSLAAMRGMEMDHVREIARRASAAVRSGHVAWLTVCGHAIQNNLDIPYSPGYFRPAGAPWRTLRPGVTFERGDFVYCVAYDEVFPDVMALARERGAGLAWSLTDYRTDDRVGIGAIGRDEIFVNQHWALGDAVVTVPGYDVRILPTSGILSEAALRMVEAEMVTLAGVPTARD
jgi:hypothetical protein